MNENFHGDCMSGKTCNPLNSTLLHIATTDNSHCHLHCHSDTVWLLDVKLNRGEDIYLGSCPSCCGLALQVELLGQWCPCFPSAAPSPSWRLDVPTDYINEHWIYAVYAHLGWVGVMYSFDKHKLSWHV